MTAQLTMRHLWFAASASVSCFASLLRIELLRSLRRKLEAAVGRKLEAAVLRRRHEAAVLRGKLKAAVLRRRLEAAVLRRKLTARRRKLEGCRCRRRVGKPVSSDRCELGRAMPLSAA